MLKNLSFILLCAALMLQEVRSCNRLQEVRGAELYCWSTQVDASVKLDQAMSKLEEIAKAHLGMEVNKDKTPQDLNSKYDVPCVDKLTAWINSNVGMSQANAMLDRVQACTGELANTMMAGKYFLADNVDKDNTNHASDPTEPQSKCEISKEYMKCISVATAGDECPVLRYP